MNMLVSEISRPAVPKTLRESISPYLLFFFTASFGGWLYEVMFYWTQHFGEFSFVELLLSYRGVLHGPWAPIYGVGAVLMVLLSQKIGKRPGRYFVVCMVVCGVVEYIFSEPERPDLCHEPDFLRSGGDGSRLSGRPTVLAWDFPNSRLGNGTALRWPHRTVFAGSRPVACCP